MKKSKDTATVKEKLFSIKTASEAKINALQSQLHKLSFQEITWLSRMEDFYLDKEYLTEKQLDVLSSLVSKHCKPTSQLTLFQS